MHRLTCVFVVPIWLQQVLSWHGSNKHLPNCSGSSIVCEVLSLLDSAPSSVGGAGISVSTFSLLVESVNKQDRNTKLNPFTQWTYRNVPKFSDGQVGANSADPDQTAPRRGAVWSGSTLFAISSASFGCITLKKSHLVQLLGWLQQIFRCPKF